MQRSRGDFRRAKNTREKEEKLSQLWIRDLMTNYPRQCNKCTMIFWNGMHVCISEKNWENVHAVKQKQTATKKVLKKFNCKHCQKEFSDFYKRRVFCSKACRLDYNVKINN